MIIIIVIVIIIFIFYSLSLSLSLVNVSLLGNLVEELKCFINNQNLLGSELIVNVVYYINNYYNLIFSKFHIKSK